jgi:hypothetical protein
LYATNYISLSPLPDSVEKPVKGFTVLMLCNLNAEFVEFREWKYPGLTLKNYCHMNSTHVPYDHHHFLETILPSSIFYPSIFFFSIQKRPRKLVAPPSHITMCSVLSSDFFGGQILIVFVL